MIETQIYNAVQLKTLADEHVALIKADMARFKLISKHLKGKGHEDLSLTNISWGFPIHILRVIWIFSDKLQKLYIITSPVKGSSEILSPREVDTNEKLTRGRTKT